jgi:hypothetical protein
MIIEFKKCSATIMKEMIESFYEIVLDDVIEQSYVWTPAEINQVLFRNFNNHKKAIEELKMVPEEVFKA